MKTCVMITGTNGVGKTTLAKALIEKYGGRANVTKTITEVADKRVCFAGPYHPDRKYGGVDAFNCTRTLADVVKNAFKDHDVIFCEGMYLSSFGRNLTSAMFSAERQLLVFLYCPPAEIKARLIKRSGAAGSSGRGTDFEKVFKKQQSCLVAARKWASAGVPVFSFNTAAVDIEKIIEQVTKKVDSLCGKQGYEINN